MDNSACAKCGKQCARKFCSPECYYASRVGVPRPDLRKRLVKNCAACGGQFETGGRGRHRGAVRFCSRTCAANARWRTGSRANELTIAQAAYLAGIIDGEGSIILYRRRANCAMRVSVCNTNRTLLEWCTTTTGVGNIVAAPRSNERHKTAYQWMANSQAGLSLLEQIRPYLVIKGAQADLAIGFQRKLKIPADKAQTEWQEQWRQRLRDMNARGPRAPGG